jgi:hypothetical protein
MTIPVVDPFDGKPPAFYDDAAIGPNQIGPHDGRIVTWQSSASQ